MDEKDTQREVQHQHGAGRYAQSESVQSGQVENFQNYVKVSKCKFVQCFWKNLDW